MKRLVQLGARSSSVAGVGDPPGDVTLGADIVLRATTPDEQGKVYVEGFLDYEPPDPLGQFSSVDVYLQAPDDVPTQPGETKAVLDDTGFSISDGVDDAASLVPVFAPVLAANVPYNPDEKILMFRREIPAEDEYWRLYAVSRAARYTKALVRAGEPGETPSLAFLVSPTALQPLVSGAEYAPNALSLTLVGGLPEYFVENGGEQTWRFTITWENNTRDPRYRRLGGYDVVIEYPDGERVTTASVDKDDLIFTSAKWPMGAPATFRVWLRPFDVNGRTNTIIDGVTRSVLVAVTPQQGGAGQEYAPHVTGFAVTMPGYVTNGQGQKSFPIVFAFTPPVDPRFAGVIIHMIRADAVDYVLTGLVPTSPFTYDLVHFLPTDENVTVYAVSVDTAGNANSYVPGSTPSQAITIPQIPSGGTGIEYCSNIVPGSPLVTLSVALPQADGTYVQAAQINGTPPNDPRWGSCDVIVEYADLSRIVWVTSAREFPIRFNYKPTATVQNARFIVVSRDVNGRRNNIDFAVTPNQIVSQGTGDGQLDFAKALSTSLGTYFEIVGGVFKIKDLGLPTNLLADLAVTSDKLATSAVITSKLANLAVDNNKLAALAVDAAKLATSAVTSTKIANAAVGSAAIANLAVGTAHIADAAIQTAKIGDAQILTAKIGDLQVSNAKILDLAAGKITAGTLVAGVVYAGTINASQINAGTLNAVNMNGGSLTLNLNGFTTTVSNGLDGSFSEFLGFKCASNSTNEFSAVTYRKVGLVYSDGFIKALLSQFAGDGSLDLHGTGGDVQCATGFGGSYLKAYNNAGKTAFLGLFGGEAIVSLAGTAPYVAINGSQIIGPRGAAVADATDAASAITQLNALLARARAHGLIAI